ncbi:MAG TPA: helix-turn-helix transcriptional regulator [Thermoanaerobaculia bacterium]|nr:helix-turn-helix transcriptional regulator [Thermoanaerobaculia bacterium]
MIRNQVEQRRGPHENPDAPSDRDARVRRALGARLARLRIERELTQKAVAAALGTTQEVVSRYERGKYAPSLAVLLGLRRLFAVTLDYLVAGAAPGELADARLRQLALLADALPPDHRTLVVTALKGLVEAAQADVRRRQGAEDAE